MKKIFAIAFIFCVLCVCSLHGGLLSKLAMLDANAKICFYCGDVQSLEDASVQKNGNGAIITCDAGDAQKVYKNIVGCFGYSIRFDSPSVLEQILAQITVIKAETQNDLQIFYGRASGAMFFDFLGGQKINVQVAVSPNYVVVGSPIILGSY